MKKLIVLLLAITMMLCFTACKDDTQTASGSDSVKAVSECTETDVRTLIDKNADCYFLFYVSPLEIDGGTDSDGYSKAQTSFFASYSELCDFVNTTYVQEKADELLNYPSAETPLYIERNGSLYVNSDTVKLVDYDIIWDDTYTIEFLTNSTTECTFSLTTTDFDGEEYTTQGKAINENGEWLLSDMIY